MKNKNYTIISIYAEKESIDIFAILNSYITYTQGQIGITMSALLTRKIDLEMQVEPSEELSTSFPELNLYIQR